MRCQCCFHKIIANIKWNIIDTNLIMLQIVVVIKYHYFCLPNLLTWKTSIHLYDLNSFSKLLLKRNTSLWITDYSFLWNINCEHAFVIIMWLYLCVFLFLSDWKICKENPISSLHICFIIQKSLINIFLYSCISLFLLLFNYNCPHPPLHFSHFYPPQHPTFNLCPVVLVHGSFIYLFLYLSLPLLFPFILSTLPSGYCQIVLYFHDSGSTLLAYLYCWLGSMVIWYLTTIMVFIIQYFSFTTWSIWLSIILNSSIHALVKGISSFFLSAA